MFLVHQVQYFSAKTLLFYLQPYKALLTWKEYKADEFDIRQLIKALEDNLKTDLAYMASEIMQSKCLGTCVRKGSEFCQRRCSADQLYKWPGQYSQRRISSFENLGGRLVSWLVKSSHQQHVG